MDNLCIVPAPQRIEALWIGGPPGKTFLKIKNKLRKLNIFIFDRWEPNSVCTKTHIPSRAEVVIINKDMTSHHGSTLARNLVDEAVSNGRQLTWSFAGLDMMRTTIPNLQYKGVLPSKEIVVKPVIKEEIVVSYETKIATLIDQFCNSLGVPSTSFRDFFQPEIKRRSQKFMDVMVKLAKNTSEPDSVGLLASLADGEAHTLNWWRNQLGTDFKVGRKKMSIFAALGYLERKEPFEGAQLGASDEPNLSFHFSLSGSGRQVLGLDQDDNTSVEEEIAVSQDNTVPNPVNPALSQDRAAALPEKAPEPVKAPVWAKPKTAGSNLHEALMMVLEVVRKEEPGVLGLYIDIASGQVRMETRTTVTFDLD